MDRDRALILLGEASVGRLGTVDETGHPHLVPVVFAVDGGTIHLAVDHKPKRTVRLKRLENIERSGRAALLVDHYEDDWTRLWWVRVDGPARVVSDDSLVEQTADLLVAKYPQYEHRRPAGPAIVLEVARVTGWAAAG